MTFQHHQIAAILQEVMLFLLTSQVILIGIIYKPKAWNYIFTSFSEVWYSYDQVKQVFDEIIICFLLSFTLVTGEWIQSSEM
jgi:hypothetical protein